MRYASKLFHTIASRLGRECDKSCSANVKTIDEFDGRSRMIGTILDEASLGFEMRAATSHYLNLTSGCFENELARNENELMQ